MSSDLRLALSRRAALFGVVLLAGCGFSPIHDSKTGVLRNVTDVEVPATAEGYALRQHLIDRLGHADSPTYRLRVDLSIDADSVAISADNLSNQIQLPGQADFALRDGNDVLIVEGSVTSFTSYSTTGSTVATLAAEENARQRLTVILGDLIVTRLLAAMIQ